ncbi:metal-sensing transcriptional repressor [Colwellia maritima]|nr:metal-sensing transcriptional repressor [Colwellia maritima]
MRSDYFPYRKIVNFSIVHARYFIANKAIKGAVNGLMNVVLEEHIREHLGADDITQQQRQEEVEQINSALKSYLK